MFMDIRQWRFQEDWFVDQAHECDRVLGRHGFSRMCDYARHVTQDDIEGLWALLQGTKKERPMHQFLSERAHLVVNADFAYGCRWVKSNPRLGDEFSADFIIGRLESIGLRWTLIELQDPDTQLFLGNGKPGNELREGLHQIRQWRGWINRWGTNGVEKFGYRGLRADFHALVVIGRSNDKRQDLQGDQRIAELEQEHRVQIRSYDSIGRAAVQTLNDCGVDHNDHQHQPRHDGRR
jgi:hypothetical protein